MYNVSAYIVYLSLVLLIVLYVGGFLFRNGKFYLEEIFHDEHLVQSVNRFMYMGYCLINAGGAFRCLYAAPDISSKTRAIEYVADNTGQLLLLLGCMHIINLFVLPLMKNLFKSDKNRLQNLKTNTYEKL